jgi:hypothetical protein
VSLKSRVILLFFEKFFFWSWVFEHGVSEFAGFGHFLLDLDGWMDRNGMEWAGLEDWIGNDFTGDSSYESGRSYACTTHSHVGDALMLMHHTVVFFVNGNLFGGHGRLLYRSMIHQCVLPLFSIYRILLLAGCLLRLHRM